MESEKIKVVLVHSGNVFPQYIDDCITQLKKYNFEIHLILSHNLHEKIKSKDIFISKVEDYISDKYNSFSLQRDNSFRDGFWTRTSSRFFLLSEYAKKNCLTDFFHIENDVLIYDDLNLTNQILKKSSYDMSLVIDSIDRCVPSIMWFKNYELLNEMCDFIYSNNYNDDMKNLNLFFKSNKKISNFPIIPIDLYNSTIKYNNMFEHYKSIFDGAAIGQYLGGIDPRNISGNTVGFVNETTVFDVSKYNFIWINEEPYMMYNNNQIKINNLHIHCKDLKKFMRGV